MADPCFICNRSTAHVDPLCERHDYIDVSFGAFTRTVSREEWNGGVPLANAVNASLMEAYDRLSTEEGDD